MGKEDLVKLEGGVRVSGTGIRWLGVVKLHRLFQCFKSLKSV